MYIHSKCRLTRLDVWPFFFVYGTWVNVQVIGYLKEDVSVPFWVTQLSGLVLISLHVLLYLFTIWSVEVRCLVRYRKVRGVEEATFVKVVPHKFTGTKEIVGMERKDETAEDGRKYIQYSFSFRKLKFLWNAEDSMFAKLKYPTKKTFDEYRKSSGYGTESQVMAALDTWGLNKFVVPIPAFWDLLKEQLLAPFFCFQVFCVALWAIDEYWYYSLMTLGMLVTFESTVVHQRLRNLSQVRALQQPQKPIKVYRGGKWVEIQGDKIVPGDVVSLSRPRDEDSIVVQADMLLLAGSCIVDEAVLTGESTPQWKNPIGEATGDEIDSSELSPSQILSVKRDKMHVVFGGTKLMQATGDESAHIKTPDQGCLAVVLRTGFGTAQGRLMRTILYSTERVSANNLETFLFILFLLVWAIAASVYVLKHGLADPDRDRFKLALNCIMILTSVVPPELPMELTIAVNASLVALARKRIFCTEPFRIPMAGKITTCCFDKTGTLTSDHMEMEGVSGSSENSLELEESIECLPSIVSVILSCCQSLVKVDASVVGDPVEVAALKATKWKSNGDIITSSNSKTSAHVLHRFHFSSALKRMSTIVKVEDKVAKTSEYFVLMKGAPETVQLHLNAIPEYFDRSYKKYAAEGARVLALASKKLPSDLTMSTLRHISRDEAESDLEFAGFAIFRSPLKDESEPALRMLKASQHQLIMITGDTPLTACHTASQVHIVTRQVFVLSANGPVDKWVWRSPDESLTEPFEESLQNAAMLASNYDLCIPGDALMKMANADGDLLNMYIPLTQVFARVTPDQKELIIKVLRDQDLSVLMCGDGTNDVGALKGAHVGVALLAPADKNKKPDPKRPPPVGKGTQMLQDMRRRGVPVTPFHERMAKMMDDMAADANDLPLVQPGDASMASPFTAKEPSVMPCLDIIRQGRCTLVTTMQMFKILGLLSLSTAYSLSVLYLDGIKLGDMQATLAGVLTAGMFFFISNAKPLNTISRERPHPRIFSLYMFLSLMGQFAIHMGFLMHMQHEAHALMSPEERQDPGAEFKPNLVNTVCFLTNFAIQTMTFAVNYVGKPFTTPLSQNTMFALSVRWSAGIYILLVLDVIDGFNGWFSLIPLPSVLKYKAIGLAAASFLACRALENTARRAFPCAIPSEKGGRTHIKYFSDKHYT